MNNSERSSFYLETYGCQMNFAESDSLELRLQEMGWHKSSTWEEADLVVINTCAVRQSAENRVWGRIGFFGKQRKTRPFKIAVLGCMAERLKEKLIERAPFVDYTPGVSGRRVFIESLAGGEVPKDEEFHFDDCYSNPSEFKVFVPIMHGCDNYCTYCIVPYVRGREISRQPEDIFRECADAVSGRVVEITLLGQNVNSYRSSLNGRDLFFPGLLEEILSRVPVPWLRFISSHPKDFSSELIRVMSEQPALCRHIHLPVQHGSDTVLTRMNRKYTRKGYLALIDSIREKIPDTAITTDILIGFPGETERDFQDTMDLLEKVAFDDAFTYFYNPREGTKAASFEDQLPLEVKKHRLEEIIALQRRITRNARALRIGKEADMLVESISKKRKDQILGRTERNEMLICPGNESMIGSFKKVRITGLSGITLKGEVV